MNVYKINEYWIAAKDADEAFGQFMEEANGLEDVFIGHLDEDEADSFTINLRRLNENEIATRDIHCCGDDQYDGCDRCKDVGDYVLISLQDCINDRKEDHFPCMLVKEL